jgi:hypothetical protein
MFRSTAIIVSGEPGVNVVSVFIYCVHCVSDKSSTFTPFGCKAGEINIGVFNVLSCVV